MSKNRYTTRKTTPAAKAETLRRKAVRSGKYAEPVRRGAVSRQNRCMAL